MALSVGEQARWWSLGLLLLALFLWLLGESLTPYLAGAGLAYFLDPVADRLERAGLSRVLATAIITLIMVGVFVAALLLLAPLLVSQLRDLFEQVPVYADAIRNFVESRYPDQLEEGSHLNDALKTLRENAQSWSVRVAENVLSGGLALIDFLMLLVVTPVVAFYLLLDWDRLVAKVDGWIPRDHLETVRGLARDIDGVLAGFVRGQLTVCAILGGYYAIALAVVGLQFGVVIGLFSGLISFIPFVGSILGGALSIGVALFQFWGQPIWIAAVAGVFFAGQAIEGNVLTPKLVGGSVGLHPVALMFALSAFGAFLGFTGLLIAVPAAACIGVLFRFAMDKYKGGRLYQGRAGAETRATAQASASASARDAGARQDGDRR